MNDYFDWQKRDTDEFDSDLRREQRERFEPKEQVDASSPGWSISVQTAQEEMGNVLALSTLPLPQTYRLG